MSAEIAITGVSVDGSAPPGTVLRAERRCQPIAWPEYQDGIISLTVIRQSHAPADLTGMVIRLGVKRWGASAALFTKTATVIDGPGGIAEIAIARDDVELLVYGVRYLYDVQQVDPGGRRSQLVPASRFEVPATAAYP